MESQIPKYHPHFNTSKLDFPETIFEQNRTLLQLYKGVNLSSGFPEWDTPKFVKDSLALVAGETLEHHYSDCAGQLDLRKTLAKTYSSTFNRELRPDNVIIGEGGTGLIFLLFYSFIKPGDEVILIEPYFQYFYFNVKMSGAVLKTCEMTPKNGNWVLDFEKLESLFTNKTRLIIVNSPHNPTGKVFSKDEVDRMMKILRKYPDVLVLADEVYEKCIYDEHEFPRIGTYAEIWNRSITIMSAGKTFNTTGWRIGYAIGSELLINGLISAQRSTIFCINRPCSAAVSRMISIANDPYGDFTSYYHSHKQLLQNSKDLLINGLSKIPQISVFPPNGGYFFIIGIQNLVKYVPKLYFYKESPQIAADMTEPVGEGFETLKDCDFTPGEACFYWLAKEIGVNLIPVDQFYENENKTVEEKKGSLLLRVSVTAKPESIQLALERLMKIVSIVEPKN